MKILLSNVYENIIGNTLNAVDKSLIFQNTNKTHFFWTSIELVRFVVEAYERKVTIYFVKPFK